METVLITGSTSGIGKDLADIFAKKKYNLVLAARNRAALDEMAEEYTRKYGIRVEAFSIDLSVPGSAMELYHLVTDKNIMIDILVNNAGVGIYGESLENGIEKSTAMLTLNITSLTELTLLFARDMKKARRGKILNVSSTAAFQPTPYLAAYAASKSFVLHFSEALYVELKKYGITVTAVCPGATGTGFAKAADMENSRLFSSGVMSSQIVAQKSYEALMKKKMTAVIGLRNKFLATSVRLFPRKWVAFIGGKVLGH